MKERVKETLRLHKKLTQYCSDHKGAVLCESRCDRIH